MGGGGVRRGCNGKGSWLFLRCSGVDGREEGGEDGARVGDAAASASRGTAEGSNSRSGIGGLSTGLLVIRNKTSRRIALQAVSRGESIDTRRLT